MCTNSTHEFVLFFKTLDVKNLSFALIVHNNPESFSEQIAGVVMVFTLVKLNDGFMIGKPNISTPSLKMTIPQPLLTMSK